jgi:hypothetical protein
MAVVADHWNNGRQLEEVEMLEENGIKPDRTLQGLCVFALWLITAVVGLLEINMVLTMATRIYAHFWGDFGFYGSIIITNAIRQFMVIPLALVLIAGVIGSGEYTYRNFGKPGALKIFGWIIAVELSILVLAFYI